MFRYRQLLWAGVLLLVLAACQGSRPQMIASYPQNPDSGGHPPLQIYPAQVTYNASMDMAVSDVEEAASQAQSLAQSYGGYLLSSQSWLQDNQEYMTVSLAVPAYNFDALHSALLGLGKLISERVSGELTYTSPGGTPNWSYITLNLQPRNMSFPSFSLGGWHPLATLEKALGVSATIFGFILDVIIWILVVIGPFVLLGWLAYIIFCRIRRQNTSE